jgi:flagellar hook assembly protein FlgD
LALLFCAATSWAQGEPEFINVSVSPVPFSPNGDGIRDQIVVAYELTDDADWVTVAIVDSADGLVKTLIQGTPQASGVTHQLTWDGTDNSSAPAPDGFYKVTFASGNSAGQDDDVKQLKLDVTRPAIRSVDLSQNPFTPDLPGSADSLEIRLSVYDSNTLDTPDSLIVAVGPAGEIPGDTLKASPPFSGDGEYSAHWKAAGREDGAYEALTQISDDAGNTSSVSAPFVLDTSAPQVGVTSPENGAVFRELPDSVFGVAFDPAGVQSMEIRYDSGPFYPVTFATLNDTAFWGAVLDDSLPGPGEHTVEVRASDRLGHIGSGGDLGGPAAISVTRDNEAPPPPTLDALPEYVRTETLDVTGGAPDAATVSLYVNDMLNPAATVDVSVSGFFEATLILEPGVNSIAASATDGAGNISGLSSSITVEYRQELGIFFNERFRPGDSFDVILEEPAQAVTIALYSMSGRLVRVLRADGPSKTFSVPWDGADDSGTGANNGVYLCRVSASLQSGSEVADKKLVALVR